MNSSPGGKFTRIKENKVLISDAQLVRPRKIAMKRIEIEITVMISRTENKIQ
jgi:hypothetical protein